MEDISVDGIEIEGWHLNDVHESHNLMCALIDLRRRSCLSKINLNKFFLFYSLLERLSRTYEPFPLDIRGV